jgi:hypothetical protein
MTRFYIVMDSKNGKYVSRNMDLGEEDKDWKYATSVDNMVSWKALYEATNYLDSYAENDVDVDRFRIVSVWEIDLVSLFGEDL